MKYSCLIMLFFVVLPLCTLGNSADNISVSISIDQGAILPYEPIGIAVIVQNQSSNDVEQTASKWTSLRIRKDGDENWQVYIPYGPQAMPMPPQKYILHPGELYQDVFLVHVDVSGRHVFCEPGIFVIQAGTPFGESDPVNITVQLPPSEVAASAALSKNKLYMYFSEYTTQALCYGPGYNASQAIDELNAFAEKFPKSRYNAWAQLGILFAKQSKSENANNSGIQNMLMEFKNSSASLSPLQRGYMLISMAVSAHKIAANGEAAWALDEIEKNHTNGYFSVLAKYLSQQYGKP